MRRRSRASQGFEAPLRLLLLCPLDFERSVLEGLRHAMHGVQLPTDAAIEVCGPGRSGVADWFADRRGGRCPARLGMLLVGTAGGLHPDLAAGTALLAKRVIDGSQRAWTPSIGLEAASGGSPRRATVLSLDDAVVSPQEKARLHASSGADAVDLESAAFASQCEDRGWPWGVVRGISDAAADSLPRAVSSWVDARGRLRPWAVLRSLACSPRTVAALPQLRRRSIASLQAAARIVAEIDAAAASTAEATA